MITIDGIQQANLGFGSIVGVLASNATLQLSRSNVAVTCGAGGTNNCVGVRREAIAPSGLQPDALLLDQVSVVVGRSHVKQERSDRAEIAAMAAPCPQQVAGVRAKARNAAQAAGSHPREASSQRRLTTEPLRVRIRKCFVRNRHGATARGALHQTAPLAHALHSRQDPRSGPFR